MKPTVEWSRNEWEEAALIGIESGINKPGLQIHSGGTVLITNHKGPIAGLIQTSNRAQQPIDSRIFTQQLVTYHSISCSLVTEAITLFVISKKNMLKVNNKKKQKQKRMN